MTAIETDLELNDGRKLHVYDTGASDSARQLTVFWHHGTPNIGSPPAPLFAASERLGIRWVSYDRPGYGGSSPNLNRNIASAAAYTAQVADALGIQRFAVMGHSGGAPHALACAALLPERVLAAVGGAGLAPFGASGLEWFTGMKSEASLRAAVQGREAKERYEASDPPFDPAIFTAADHAALSGAWNWLNSVVGPAQASGPGGLIDDDLAYVNPWGFDPAEITCPVLLLHGQQDRVVPSSHSEWLARHCPTAELRLYPEDGHLSVLNSSEAALEWLRAQADHA
jgi:pimeloyl-ACP methyl ester carboxylesterase